MIESAIRNEHNLLSIHQYAFRKGSIYLDVVLDRQTQIN